MRIIAEVVREAVTGWQPLLVFISIDLEEHRQHIQGFFDLGFNEVHVHNVGRNQSEWIRAYGESVIPALVS